MVQVVTMASSFDRGLMAAFFTLPTSGRIGIKNRPNKDKTLLTRLGQGAFLIL
jgi:hypothetical protein